MFRAVDALRSAGVPVACAVDIDLLQNEGDFQNLVRVFGASPDQLKASRNVIVSQVEARTKKPKRSEALNEITNILNNKQSLEITSSERRKINAALSGRDGWKEFKSLGQRMLRGDGLNAFNALDETLRRNGIFLVQCGELENFHRDISSDDKAGWLREVLAREAHINDPEARRYVKDIVTYLEQ